MRLLFSRAAFAALALFTVANAERASLQFHPGESIEKEDEMFWDRFLKYHYKKEKSMSMPEPVACEVQVDLDCETPDGQPCSSLTPPPSSQCADGTDISTVTFSYQACLCVDSSNQQGPEADCSDLRPLDTSESILLSCQDVGSGANLNVDPSLVPPGDSVSVTPSGGGSLPDKIQCTISSASDNMPRQIVIIDTSGNVELDLKDKFGALQLEACDDVTCLETLCYDVTLTNIGTNVMDITVVDFDFNGEVTNLVPELPTNPLQPGESTSVEQKEVADVCVTAEYCAQVDVDADSPDGLICRDDAEDKFNINPSCAIDLELNCVSVDDGTPCEQLDLETVQPVCDCAPDCPTELRFRYTASSCAQPGPDCMDMGALPQNEARIMVVSGGVTYFEGDVAVNTDLIIDQGGSCLPESFMVFISETGSGSVRQMSTIDTGCITPGAGVTLQESFGALDFTGYTCDPNDVNNCFVGLALDVCAENEGTIDLTITRYEVNIDGTVTDLTQGVSPSDLELSPGQEFCDFSTAELFLCGTPGTFVAEAVVEADDASGVGCKDQGELTVPYPGIGTPPPFTPPTPPPSPEPSAPPTPEPRTPEPTPMPTEECVLELDLECTIDGQPCQTPGIEIEPCRQRPFASTMLYNGGDCSQSDNRQFLKFTCQDTEFGPPPTEEGAMSYIIVTDARGQGIVYHRDFVAVGDTFFLQTPEGEDRFEADQRIMIYRNDQVGVPSNLLQQVQFHSSCSSNLELKNRFGASQLVEFVNELQGNVSCFAAAVYDFQITIPITIEGTSATITSLTALTNFAGFVDLTDQVAGMTIPAGGSITVSIPVEIDLTERKRYTVLTQVEAVVMPSGQRCTGTDFNSFLAGNPTPPTLPTRMPTRRPTVSPAPTPDRLNTACSIVAMIVCETVDEAGRIVQDCESVRDPRTVTCGMEMEATGLEFRYLGGTGFPNDAFIQVAGGRTGVVLSQPVSVGETFRADGDFRGTATVTVSELLNGGAGTEIQSFEISTACNDNVLTLTTTFGPLELIGFENALGFMTSIEDVRWQYYVSNARALSLVAESALIDTEFQDPFQAITTEQVVDGLSRILVHEESQVVDFGQKAINGETYSFTMDVTGRGEASGLPCSDSTTLSF